MLTQIRPTLKIFVVWVLLVYLSFYFGFIVFHQNKIDGKDSFFQSFFNWDAGHFLSIAESGYRLDFQYAFFPLYPVLINLFSNLTLGNFVLSSLIISLLCAFFSVVIFKKIIVEEYDEKIFKKALILLLFFPASFFLLLPYSESLFLLLSITTFYFLQRKNYFLAAIFASLSPLVRITGIIAVMVFLYEVFTTKVNLKNRILSLLSTIGFLSYLLWLYIEKGTPFYFLVAEGNWQRYLTLPGFAVWEALKLGFSYNSVFFVDVIFLVIGLGLTLRSFRYLKKSYSLYCLGAISLPLFTSSIVSMPRFVLVLFPLFILVARMISNRFMSVYLSLSVLILIVSCILFINGYWIS